MTFLEKFFALYAICILATFILAWLTEPYKNNIQFTLKDVVSMILFAPFVLFYPVWVIGKWWNENKYKVVIDTSKKKPCMEPKCFR